MNQRNRNHRCMLIFVEGPKWSDTIGKYSWRNKLRMIWDKPAVAWQLAGGGLQAFLIGSRFRHVVITDGAVVCDYQYKSVKFWAYEEFIIRYPNILGWTLLDTDKKVDFSPYEGITHSLFMTTVSKLLMCASRGIIQMTNCVTLVRGVAECAGVKLPRKAWNPKLLLQHLTENGCDFTSGKPPSLCGGAD
mgnify:CR=1 FL=1